MLSIVCTYLVATAFVIRSQSCRFVCLPYLRTVPNNGRKNGTEDTIYVLSVNGIKILLVHSMSQS